MAVGVALTAVPVLHYLLHEPWLNSFIIPLFGVAAGVSTRLATRRGRQKNSRDSDSWQ
jgi:hypothetical protein